MISFPHASDDFKKANPQVFNEANHRSEPSRPKPQPASRRKPLDSDQGKTSDAGRCILRYTTRRCRLLDEDNWCTKYFTDALRYCGALPDDTPEHVTISVTQEKVAHRSQEKTIIELDYPSSD